MSKEETRTVTETPTTADTEPDTASDGPAPGHTRTGAGTTGTGTESPSDGTTGGEGHVRTPGETTIRSTDRWLVGVALAMIAGLVGLIANSPAIFLAAIVGLGYVAYGYANRPPSTTVLVDRSISDTSPLPGDRVEVTVLVENVDTRSIPDLRIRDTVPEDLPVVEGSPGFATSLAPGDADMYSYVLTARRGTHEVGPTEVVSRNVSGATERRRRLENRRSLTCRGRLEKLPLTSLTVPYTGRVETDTGGEGLEFWSTRRYNHGDPMNRIDWNRYARTNELTTILYRQTEAATVVVMVDVREQHRVVRRRDDLDSLALCRHAGKLVASTLLDANNRVGVALYGEGTYLTQGGGQSQKIRVDRLLGDDHEGLRPDDSHVRRTRSGSTVTPLREYIPDSVQVVFVSPLLDDAPVDIVPDMAAHGHAMTVISPAMPTSDTPGGTVSLIDRAHRIQSIRAGGIRVIDWSPEEPLQAAVERASERWSQ